MARPSKYTPERVNRIIEALKAGCSRRDAYEYGGIDEATFARWLIRFAGFAGLVRDAESEAAFGHTKIIFEAGKKDWRASLEWLKRRRREDWGDSINADITSGGQAIPIKEIIVNRPSAADSDE